MYKIQHINSPISEEIPSIDRIKAFENICLDKNIEHMVFYEVFNNDISDTTSKLFNIFKKIEAKYNGKKIGVFLSNDTLANYFIKKMCIRDSYYSIVNIYFYIAIIF